jgi:hypothetical protein
MRTQRTSKGFAVLITIYLAISVLYVIISTLGGF